MATKYVDRNLNSGEKVCYRGRVSWVAALHRGVIGFILAIIVGSSSESGSALAVVGTLALIGSLILIAQGILLRMTTEYAVTDRRVIGKYGLIRQQSVDILLRSMSGAAVSNTVLGRFFSYGNVVIAGTGARRELVGLASPKSFKSAIDERLDDSRLMHGTAAYTLNVRAAPDDPQQPAATSPPAPSAGGEVAVATATSAFCGHCGSQVGAGIRFCQNCGSAVG